VLLGLCISCVVNAQSDSKLVLSSLTSDTASILDLISKGNSLLDSSPADALQYLVTAAERSRQIGFESGLAKANARIGRWYFSNNSDKTIEYAKLALEYFDREKTLLIDEKAEVHLLLAETFDEQGKQDSSAYYYYLLSSEIESGELLDANLAIDLYTKLTIFWINLDYGASENSDYFITLRRYVDKARQAASKIKDSADAVSSVYFLEGAYYHALQKFDSARYYYLTYISERDKLKKMQLQRRISAYANIVDTYLRQSNPDDALHYIQKVLDLGNTPEKSTHLYFYMQFVNLLKGKALFQQQHYQASIALLNQTLENLKKTGSHLRGETVEAYKILADCYGALGNYQEAFAQEQKYFALNDSLMKGDKLNMVSRLEIRYRMAEKDKALAEQKLQIAEIRSSLSKRNFVIGIIALLALTAGLAFTLWNRKNIHNQRLQQERIYNLQQKMEIERLNAAIDGEEKERTRIARELHDGIGALLAAAKMNFELVKKKHVFAQDPDLREGIKLLEETASALRETAHNIMPEVLMTEGLPAAVQAFCERMTGKGGTIINCQVLGSAVNFDEAVNLPLYRIIQELIHNIKKHAAAANALVQMDFHEDGGLDVTIEDDGSGMDDAKIGSSSGMGLKNIAGRVKQLGGRIDINSSPGGGTSIYIEFERGVKI
jgi:signal transduction histidine kinase